MEARVRVGTLQRKGKEIQSPVFQRKRRKANARLWESGLRPEDLGKTWI